MRENLSKYYYPRTRLRKETHMFLSVTSMPLFPMMCGMLLDIQSALALTQSCVNCAAHKQYLFYYADVHFPVRGPSREGTDVWEAYLRSDLPTATSRMPKRITLASTSAYLRIGWAPSPHSSSPPPPPAMLCR